ncbi:NAD(P)-binding domain protein [Niveomyces insectorum RCEF 264]|uniref:NAD(P)-binding domain protein n=1 Tax=Niveomyces insectorum RCEF 264 TaxID=1081102 RepID=A0A167P052_9HYPO|nr:NAD(P)-binding domain protein [Niveomyces insectorum RCEF 264]
MKIFALTRDSASARAQALVKAHPEKINLVQGDVLKPATIFSGQPHGSVFALFVVTNPSDEEAQAIPLIDAAVSHGVRHIVFSSVDRGGDVRSWNNPTNVRHFYEKHNIEVYLRDKARKSADGTTASSPASSPFTWTILRPVAFMDNMVPGMACSLFMSWWSISVERNRKLQLVATTDIGIWGARSIITSAKAKPGMASPYVNRAISLAGDELTLVEARQIFRRVVGHEAPKAWWIFGRILLWAIGDMNKMFAFFQREGYGADIAAVRAEEPELKNFETWLRDESGWTKEK